VADKILLVEDEKQISRTLRLYLEQAGFHVVAVEDGALVMAAFRRERPTLVVLDLMLPNVDGLDLCRQMRRESGAPIIMLTARIEEADRLIGLELGADDYVTKPFSPREVVARVKVVLRRTRGEVQPPRVCRVGDLEIDLERHQVAVGGLGVDLTPLEFDLLSTLARSPGQVFSRLQLLDQLQGEAFEGFERAVDQHVKNLRAKLGDDARHPRYVETVFGVGYRLIRPDEEHA
jgi:two-component system alkaline phosphatase synthesis response regulator PhoP